jgi:chorismate mutase
MNKVVKAIRGACCSANTKEEITKNVCDLFNKIAGENKLESEDLISIHFSVTKDITVLNPATALRKGNPNIDVTQAALFCTQEAEIEGGLPSMIRVMVTAYMDSDLKKTNVYLNGAEKLRPDYCNK